MNSRSVCLALVATALAPLGTSGLRAQTPAGGVVLSKPSAPASVATVKVDGRKLKPGTWTYRTTMSRAGQSQVVQRQLSVSSATLNGAPAWLVVDAQGDGPAAIADSLYLTQSDVLPLRHHLTVPQGSVALDFGRDSVHGTMKTPQGSAPLAAPYTRGAIVTGTMLELYLRLLPVAPGWKQTLTMGPVGPNGSTLVPVTLATTREETVTVPAGSFPAYVVSMQSQGTEQTVWVTKGTHDIVKVTADHLTAAPGVSFETVLLSHR